MWNPVTRLRAPSRRPTRLAWRRVGVVSLATVLIAVAGISPSRAQPRTWEEQAPPETPSPRFAPGIAFDAARNEVVMFGGGDGMVRKGMWRWDGSTWSKVHLPGNVSKPEGRFDTGMAYDAANGEVVLFGGETRSSVVGDTWTWDGSSWSEQSSGATPGARTGLGMVYDAVNGEVVLFGGQAADGSALGDTWTWDGTTWTQRTPSTSPPARHHGAMVYDGANGEVVLFGGQAADGSALGDTWTWDGTTWTQEIPNTSPTPRSRASIAFDAAHGDVVLFGGSAVVPSDEMWSWNGTSWSELNPPTRPSARTDAAMVYDGANDEVVLFGGRVAKDFNDTWILVELTPVEGPNLGGGTVSGTVQFDGAGIPVVGEPCEPTSFDLEADAVAVIANLAPTTYAGPITVTGTGANPCETTAAGAGTLDLVARGEGTGGSRIDCGPLRGSFTRAASAVTAVLGGPCIVNEFATGNITFVAKVEFHPTQGDGVTTRVTEAAFDGAFTVLPD